MLTKRRTIMKAKTKLMIFRIVVLTLIALFAVFVFDKNILGIQSFVSGKRFIPFLVTVIVLIGGYFAFIIIGIAINELFSKAKKWKIEAKNERK